MGTAAVIFAQALNLYIYVRFKLCGMSVWAQILFGNRHPVKICGRFGESKLHL